MKRRKRLRTGYTTGACAAAAAKGALLCLLGKSVKEIEIDLPCKEKASIVSKGFGRNADAAFCQVVKDAGDDPDVTNGAIIRADVRLLNKKLIVIKGGKGVGVVTRPGLAVSPGKPAINPVPRKMIRKALKNILPEGKGAEVTISVAGGEELARKTLNPRLGIVGGISILGTTGLVVPYSHQAYRESIVCAFDVARAMGLETVVLSTGRKSEKVARGVFPELPEPAFVLMADYFSFAVSEALKHSIRKIVLSCFPGKLLKVAAGAGCTHYSKSTIDLEYLAGIAAEEGVGSKSLKAISSANTVRHAFAFIPEGNVQKVCARMSKLVRERIRRQTHDAIKAEILIISYENKILYHGR